MDNEINRGTPAKTEVEFDKFCRIILSRFYRNLKDELIEHRLRLKVLDRNPESDVLLRLRLPFFN